MTYPNTTRETTDDFLDNSRKTINSPLKMLGTIALGVCLAACGDLFINNTDISNDAPTEVASDSSGLLGAAASSPSAAGVANEPTVVGDAKIAGGAPSVVPLAKPAAVPTTATVPTVPSLTGTALTVSGMKADMIGAHESTIVGVPPEWSWGSQADPGFGLTGFPTHWTSPAYTMWGIVGPADSGSPATNVRVQIRRLRADFKRNGSWYRAQYEKTGFGGANYTDYSTNASSPADVVQLGAEGLAVKVIQNGGHYHFYSSYRVPFHRDLQGLVVSMDVRLVKNNPNGIDDIDSARIYGVAAGDVYQSMSAQWNGTNWVNGHAPIGRFRKIGRNWQTITAHQGLSSDAQFQEYIAWAGKQPQ